MERIDLPHFRPIYRNTTWARQIFGSEAARTGGIVRRSVRSVEKQIGRQRLIAECRARGIHLLECGDQFVIICNGGSLRMLC